MNITAFRARRSSGAVRSLLVASVIAAGLVGAGSASAAATAGVAEIVSSDSTPDPIAGGGGTTSFGLRLPVGAACTGDTATDGYLAHSYMVPSAVDPATLTYEGDGPTPLDVGAAFRQPMFAAGGGTPWVANNTAPDSGFVNPPTELSLGVFGDGGAAAAQTIVPPGVYNVGIACVLGLPSATQLDKYWNVQIEIVHDSADPIGLTWTVVGGAAPTTTTTTTTEPGTATTIAGATTTSTTIAGATTTTIAGPSNAPGTPTTTLASTNGGTTTLPSGVAGAGGTGGGTTGSSTGTAPRPLPSTGASWVPFVFWAIVLLVLGRIAVLTARRVVVERPPNA